MQVLAQFQPIKQITKRVKTNQILTSNSQFHNDINLKARKYQDHRHFQNNQDSMVKHGYNFHKATSHNKAYHYE